MASGTSSVLIGSHGSWPSSTVTINGTDYEIAATTTGMYLTHSTAALSWLDQLKTHMDTELGGTNVARLNDSGKAFISNSLGNFTVTWTDALNQTISGFTQGNLSGASSYTANDLSPYLWLPGRTENPMGRLGSQGKLYVDTQGGTSRDGTPGGRVLGTQFLERLLWTEVGVGRYHDTSDEERFFIGWWKTVGARRRRFFHYRNVSYDDAGTSAISLGTGLGPYVCDIESGGRMPGQRSQGYEFVEVQYDVPLSCHIAPEYT